MRKMIVVAVREYQAAVRTKAFIITLVAMPVFMGGSIAVQLLLKDKKDVSDRKVALVDYSGLVGDALAAEAQERNRTDIFESGGGEPKQTRPRFLVERIDPGDDDPEKVQLKLSDRVRDRDLFAFVVIPAGIERTAEPGATGGTAGPSIQYHTDTPTYRDLPRWLTDRINKRVREIRFDAAGLDPAVVSAASERLNMNVLGLLTVDESGKITHAERANRGANIGIAAGLMMLMLMVVMVGAGPLMQSVLEEKMQRIAEVLLGSIPPFQLMMGKLLGTVGVSLTLTTVYLVGGFIALSYAGYARFLPPTLIWWFLLYQSLAVLLYGSLFISVGAAVSDLKESQSLMTPLMVVVMAPIFLWANVIQAPSATFSVVASLFPPATPMLMLLRQSIPPGVPLWQPLLGVVLVALTTLLFVFAAGRVFRIGILMQGKGAKFGEMLRWALRG
ncbi:MAG: ABC transporter permease [Phycisphaerae bacterium]